MSHKNGHEKKRWRVQIFLFTMNSTFGLMRFIQARGALAFIIFKDDILAFPEPTMWLHCPCGRQHCTAIATSSATIKNGEGISS